MTSDWRISSTSRRNVSERSIPFTSSTPRVAVRTDERNPVEINTLQVIRNWPEEVKAAFAKFRGA